MSTYDETWVRDHFDEFAEREWDRLTGDPISRIQLAIHAHYLRAHVESGSRVLEIGAGPGRFTEILADIGCSVVVADISPVQLELSRKMADKHGFDSAVESRLELDIVDMSALDDRSFDAVVCYGGPLSYVFDRSPQAVSECLRVLRPGGVFLASVMSLWGSAHSGIPFVLGFPTEVNDHILSTGDITPEVMPEHGHYCHMFRAAELRTLLEGAGVQVIALSASNALSSGWAEELAEITEEDDRWKQLVTMEIEACREPGCLDMGTHIVAVGRKV